MDDRRAHVDFGDPAEFRKNLKMNREGWAYAHYTAGMGLGSATLDCRSPLVAGAVIPEATIRFMAGKGGIAPGGMTSVWLPNGTQPPQIDDKTKPSYLEVAVDGRPFTVRLQNTWMYRTEGDPTLRQYRRMADVLLPQGLPEGGQVTWRWTRAGFGRLVHGGYDDRAHFRVFVDHDADGWEEEIAGSPWVPMVADAAGRLMLRAAATAVVGQPVRLTATAMDAWNNAATGYRGTVEFAATTGPDGKTAVDQPAQAELPGPWTFNALDRGSHTFAATFSRPGFYWVTIKDPAAGFTAESNPIEVFAEEPEYRLYWGDLHVHTEMSADACNGVMCPSTYADSYRIGCERYGLDFQANTDHHGYSQGNYDESDWEVMKQITNRADAPGRFVTLVATEISHGRGDQNVYFPAGDAPYINTGPRHPLDMWEFLRRYECFTVPHHFAQSMRPWDWNNYDARLMPLAEIYSNHGRAEFTGNQPHYSRHPTPTIQGKTWQDQLARGRKLGAIAASDDHFAQPGYSGLAGVWAKSLTRAEIYRNLKAKHCYATTNARAIIHFTLNGAEMGSVVRSADAPSIKVRAACPSAITEAVIVRNGQTVYTAKPAGRVVEFEWTDPSPAGEAYYYLRLKQTGQPTTDDLLKGQPDYTWSTPVWIEKP
ncbi:MAG: DUF3604 domain-containing protein [bacterium]|nr:DUF3604 domain-containing protein [bacterium]